MPVNPANALAKWATTKADAVAFTFLERGEREAAKLTFRQLYGRALAIAGMLRQRGLAGEPVLLVFPPGLDFIAALFGCFISGAIAVPAPYLLPKRSIARIAAIQADAGCRAVLVQEALGNDREMTEGPLAALERIAVGGETDDAPARVPGISSEPGQVALLQYTSGSTSTPKGVAITHGNLLANQEMIAAAFGHDQSDRLVSWLPMFHDMGLVGAILQPVHIGASAVLMSPLDFLQRPARWLRAISRYGATTSGAPSFAYGLCARSIRPDQLDGVDLSTWKLAFCGAEPVRAPDLRAFAETFSGVGFAAEAIYPCYGLSEATLFVSGGPPGTGLKTESRAILRSPAVSCGTVAGAGDVVIVDPETRKAVAPGEIGEIWVGGPHVGAGYWRRPDETQQVFAATLASGGGRAFLRTGDLGFLSEGRLFPTGRIKDLLIVRGAKHHPEEVEASLAASHAALAGGLTAAFAVDAGDHARIVLAHELDRRDLGRTDLDAALEAAFGAVVEDHGIRVDDILLLRPAALARTTSGKVQRHRCRADYETGRLEAFVVTRFRPAADVAFTVGRLARGNE